MKLKLKATTAQQLPLKINRNETLPIFKITFQHVIYHIPATVNLILWLISLHHSDSECKNLSWRVSTVWHDLIFSVPTSHCACIFNMTISSNNLNDNVGDDNAVAVRTWRKLEFLTKNYCIFFTWKKRQHKKTFFFRTFT